MRDPEGDRPVEAGARTNGDLPRNVLDHLLEGFQVIGPDLRYLYVNEAVLRQARATRDELLGRTMTECFPGIERSAMFPVLRACMDERVRKTMENEFAYPDGSTGWFELRFEPVPEGVAILSVDVTERKRHEAALRRAMRALTTLSRSNRALVRATSEADFVQEVCDLLHEDGGYQAAWIDLFDPRGSEHGRRRAAGAGDPGADSTPAASAALGLDVRAGGASIGVLTIVASEQDAFDVDERALLDEVAMDLGYGIHTLRARVTHEITEQQLVAAQRLEAVGRLAGGVAHDFNNILSVILSYTSFVAEALRADDPLRKDVEQVHQAGQRAAGLTRQLLAFSRKQVMEPRVTCLNDVVAGIETMLRRLLGEDVDVEVHAARDLGNVLADPGQIEQVIMNLAVNARDAMPEGGKLTIETANVELDEAYADRHVSVTPGRYVRLCVADSGTGMTPEVRERVFEPFFTTKEKGKGTGLGLSMVYGIVKQSGGNVWVYSEPGRGTTFKIYLPRVDAPTETVRPTAPATPATGDETVLVVEDDGAVREAVARILEAAGYRVLAASGGAEALRLGEEHRERIALVLTDVVMPEMSGRELAERLARLVPGLRVLFTSGYTDSAIIHHGVLDGGTRFIGKPFSVAELTRKVREVLDGA